jgi:hypothetical protein
MYKFIHIAAHLICPLLANSRREIKPILKVRKIIEKIRHQEIEQ